MRVAWSSVTRVAVGVAVGASAMATPTSPAAMWRG